MNLRKCPGPALLAPCQQPLWLLLILLALFSRKTLKRKHRRLLYERSVAAASTDNTRMFVVENRSAEVEPLPQIDTFLDAELYIKLKATLRIMFVSGWGFFIHKYQFNELD